MTLATPAGLSLTVARRTIAPRSELGEIRAIVGAVLSTRIDKVRVVAWPARSVAVTERVTAPAGRLVVSSGYEYTPPPTDAIVTVVEPTVKLTEARPPASIALTRTSRIPEARAFAPGATKATVGDVTSEFTKVTCTTVATSVPTLSTPRTMLAFEPSG